MRIRQILPILGLMVIPASVAHGQAAASPQITSFCHVVPTANQNFDMILARVHASLAGHSVGSGSHFRKVDHSIQEISTAVREVIGDQEAEVTITTIKQVKAKHPEFTNQGALDFALGMAYSPDKAAYRL